MPKPSIVFLFFFIFMVFYVKARDLLLTSSLDFVLTPCHDDSDCDDLQNAVCEKHFCKCNGTKICEDKTATVVTKIGEFCKINADCNIEHSLCLNDKCNCSDGRVGSTDGRKCLIISNGLSSSCEDSIQCYTKIPHSGCQNDRCVCQQHMHEHDGLCYKNVGLSQKCESVSECSAIAFAKCINEECVCKDGYIQNSASNKCLEIANKINAPCYEDIQCSAKFGRAYCKEGHCQCNDLYMFKWANQKCVADLLLGEKCMNDSDCHGPEPRESKLECILGECKCKSKYKEEHGVCDSSAIKTSLAPGLIGILLLISCYFYFNEILLWVTFIYAVFYMLYITIFRMYNNNFEAFNKNA